MQTPTWRSICAMLCLLLLLPALFPVKAAAETVPAKVVRVGSFEDTFNYVNEKGIRKGYGYELLQTLSGYTGWQLEYVTCDWSDCFEKLKNGEIDIMGDISYTEDRTEEMLFSDEPMGEEKDYLYADLSREDITASDFKTLNGKKIGVLMGTEPEVMLTEWEEKYDLKTQHVNISNNEDAKQKLANHEIDCFVSMEESFWTELGISTITRVGSSDIYYAINKDRADIKEELDNAMRALEDADPFYTADLYKRYFSMDYTPILTGEEKAWLKKHGAIRMGFLTGDSGVSVYDPSTGELTGTITDYIRFAKDCLGNQELEFQMVGYDSKEAELDALKSGEIDMVFHFDQSPNLAEEYRVACTNTTWTSNMMAVTNKEHFNETQANRVAVPQNKISLTRYLAVYYPQWEIVDCAAQEDAARLVKDGQADCFVTGVSSQENYSKKYDFYSVPLPNPAKSCFAVNSGNGILLSILNKTIKAMPANMLTGALAMYKSAARKVTLSEFIRDNFFMVLLVSSIFVAAILLAILKLLRKARKAEAAARKAANDTQELNAKLQIAAENAESANRAKSTFLFNMSHDIRTPMNAIIGYADLAVRHSDDPAKLKKYMENIQVCGQNLLMLLNNVLDLARIENDKTEMEYSVSDVEKDFRNCLAMFRNQADSKGQTLTVTTQLPYPYIYAEFPIVKDTTPNMMNPRLYTTSYNKPQGQQFDTAVLSFIKLQYTEKSCKMINIFVLVTILGHLPVILSAKSKGSEDMKQILIVEDDSFLNKMLAYNLTADGYGVTSALNARTAADAIRQREFDLVLLDINLPDGNGFELCKLIKPQHPDTIVIFLTANDQESDQIRGYEVGAVDYITKPFVIGALQRKIKAMFAMLEHHKPAKDIYDDGRLFLDFSEQTASLNGKPLTLSPMEYKMLNLFRKNPRQVLTRGQLLEKLWDIDERFVDEHTLTTSISRIRSKIEADGGAPYIKTVYGMGYQWTGGEAK